MISSYHITLFAIVGSYHFIHAQTIKSQSSLADNDRCQRLAPGRHVVRLPVAGDCTRFLECINGTGTASSCPAGFHFNPTGSACDFGACPVRQSDFNEFDEVATTQLDAEYTGTGRSMGGATGAESPQLMSGTGRSMGGAAGAEPTPVAVEFGSVRCPKFLGVKVVIVQFPDNASSQAGETGFFKCSEAGVPIQLRCPPGKQYDANAAKCVQVMASNCQAPELAQTAAATAQTTRRQPTFAGNPFITTRRPLVQAQVTDSPPAPANNRPQGVSIRPFTGHRPVGSTHQQILTTRPTFAPVRPQSSRPTRPPPSTFSTTRLAPTTTRQTNNKRPADSSNTPVLSKYPNNPWLAGKITFRPVDKRPTYKPAGFTGSDATYVTTTPRVPTSSTRRPQTPPPGLHCPTRKQGQGAINVPNPDDCTSFFKCSVNNRPIWSECPIGLHYSAEKQLCDYPSTAKCSTSPDGKPTHNLAPTAPPSIYCPAGKTDQPLHHVNPNDCNSFFKCSEFGYAVFVPCPPTLHYNAERQACDYPEKAGCTIKIKPPVQAPSETSEEEDQLPSQSSVSNYFQHFSTPYEPIASASIQYTHTSQAVRPHPQPSTAAPHPSIKCPYGSKKPIHHANPDDCTTFYKCSEAGKAVLIPCPKHLHYNPTKQYCDYPQAAGCETGAAPYYPEPSSIEATESFIGSGSSVVTQWVDYNQPGLSYGSSTAAAAAAGVVPSATDGSWSAERPYAPPTIDHSVVCPESVNETLLPNPKNCSTYFACVGKVPFVQACPPSLHFNAALKQCDYPQQAGCYGGVVEDSWNAAAAPSNTDIYNPIDSAPTVQVYPENTDTFGGGQQPAQFVPDNSVAASEQYPAENYPPTQFEIQPAVDGDQIAQTDTVIQVQPTNTVPEHIPAIVPAASQPISCPPENSNNFLPHPSDCQKFFACQGGVPQIRKCPQGFHFDAPAQECSLPQHARCAAVGAGGGSVHPQQPSQPYPQAPSGSVHPQQPSIPYPQVPPTAPEQPITSFGEQPPTIHYPPPPQQQPEHFVPEQEYHQQPQPTQVPQHQQPTTAQRPVNPSSPGLVAFRCPVEDLSVPAAQSADAAAGGDATAAADKQVLYENPGDCGSFFACFKGRSYLFNCPVGLHYNRASAMCDYPANAGCDLQFNTIAGRSAPYTNNALNGGGQFVPR